LPRDDVEREIGGDRAGLRDLDLARFLFHLQALNCASLMSEIESHIFLRSSGAIVAPCMALCSRERLLASVMRFSFLLYSPIAPGS